MTDEEAYRALGVAPGAEAKDVQAAYRRKALELHPDRAGSADQSQYFYRRFLEVRDAYEHLRREGFPAAQAIPEPEEVAPEMPRDWESWVATRWHQHHTKQTLGGKATFLEKLGLDFKVDVGAVVLWVFLLPGCAYVLVRFIKFVLAAVRGPQAD